MNESLLLSILRERLQSLFEIEQVILFGSRARGTPREESDWDVLVIANSDLPFLERQGVAQKALGRRNYPLDLLLYTAKEAEEAAKIPGSAVYWAHKEGRRLYVR